ncbi:MAG: LemA family protein [Planctomycetota bacterium]|jgi:LemA protein
MKRIGAIVKRLYGEDVKPSANVNKAGVGMNERPSRKENRLTTFKKALGSRRTMVWTIRIVAVLVVLFIVAESIFQYNRFAAWQTKVNARRADVNRELQRRENLIPNIVATVSKYAAYEQGVFKHVSDVRTELKKIKSSKASSAQISSVLEKALSGLIALAEEYPDLKATNSIQDLIREAANTEDRIAEVKKEYNKDCEVYNQYLSVFPGNFFGWVYRYKLAPYIGLEEEVNVPVIDLDMTGRLERIEENAEGNTYDENITKQKIKRQKTSDVSLENLEKTEGVKE